MTLNISLQSYYSSIDNHSLVTKIGRFNDGDILSWILDWNVPVHFIQCMCKHYGILSNFDRYDLSTPINRAFDLFRNEWLCDVVIAMCVYITFDDVRWYISNYTDHYYNMLDRMNYRIIEWNNKQTKIKMFIQKTIQPLLYYFKLFNDNWVQFTDVSGCCTIFVSRCIDISSKGILMRVSIGNRWDKYVLISRHHIYLLSSLNSIKSVDNRFDEFLNYRTKFVNLINMFKLGLIERRKSMMYIPKELKKMIASY